MILTLDEKRRPNEKRHKNPVKTGAIERRYRFQLTKVAEQVGAIIHPFRPGDMSQVPTIQQLLKAYSDMLQQWAVTTASNMLMDVALRDEQSWKVLAKDMSRGLREEIRDAPTGKVMRELLADQVHLIKSIPTDAAKRVHDLTLAGIENSARASEIAAEIMRSGDVAKSRAMLIARTEVARTSTTLTQARAQHIGADSYVWRTSGDSDVRSEHRKLNGKIFRWDDPPIADEHSGARANPGCIWNCRCYAEPIIPD